MLVAYHQRWYTASMMRAKELSMSLWIASFIALELLWTFGGSLVTYVALKVAKDSFILTFVALHLNFLLLLALIWFFVRHILGSTLIQFSTQQRPLNFRVIMRGIIIACLLSSLAMFGLSLLKPDVISLNPELQLASYLRLALCILILTPLQCFAEELLFRAWFLQMLPKNRTLVLIFSSLTFTLAHVANVELQRASRPIVVLAYYIIVGALFMHLTLCEDGIESALGLHIGINLFTALFVNYQGSTLPSRALFIRQASFPWLSIAVVIVATGVVKLLSTKKAL